MKKHHLSVLFLVLLAVTPWRSSSNAASLGPDILYVGDESDSTVKSFSAQTGEPGAFVTQNTGRLVGPMGLLIAGPELIVVNQNVNLSLNGEILQYQLKDGSFAGAWVPSSDPNAPFAPRGAVLLNGVLYVANLTSVPDGTPGAVYVFSGNGKLLGKLTPSGDLASRFFPRSVVLNPRDGLLYVSSDPGYSPSTGPGNGGQVFKFNPSTLDYEGVFINETGGHGQLNRPEGLVFGPDGNLYITSFRGDPTDTDSIRIYNRYGHMVGEIQLDFVNQPRAFAQALLFGPGGKLFVPISGNGPLTGQIRQYDVRTKAFDVFVRAGTLGAPFYLTFGRTNSATLEYGFQSEHERD